MRSPWILLGAVGITVGLFLAWPSIMAGARKPLIDGWCPERDPGVTVVYLDGQQSTEFMVGRYYHAARTTVDTDDPATVYTKCSHSGDNGVSVVTSGNQSLNRWFASGYGYDGAATVEMVFDPDGPDRRSLVFGTPVRVTTEPDAGPHRIVELSDPAVTLEWSQVDDRIELHLVPTNVSSPPDLRGFVQLGAGQTTAHELFVQEPGGYVARIDRAAAAAYLGMDLNTLVTVSPEATGQRVDVVLRKPY